MAKCRFDSMKLRGVLRLEYYFLVLYVHIWLLFDDSNDATPYCRPYGAGGVYRCVLFSQNALRGGVGVRLRLPEVSNSSKSEIPL